VKILPPDSISSELLNLIHSANQYLVLVSPYVRIGQWPRLTAALTSAQHRGVQIKAFVRHDPDNASSWEELEALGIRPRLIAHLHAKFYFSERCGLISSLNLLSSSHSHALEIGCTLETAEELQELKDYVKRYIVPLEQTERPSEEDLYLSKEKFTVVLENYLGNCTQSRSQVFYRNNAFEMKTVQNTFYLDVDKGANRLAIMGIVSGEEATAFHERGTEFFPNSAFQFDLANGRSGYHGSVQGTYKHRLSTTYLDQLRLQEKKDLLEAIVNFVVGVRDLKEAVYAPKRAEQAARKAAYEQDIEAKRKAKQAEAERFTSAEQTSSSPTIAL
jgi:hypothetical protein